MEIINGKPKKLLGVIKTETNAGHGGSFMKRKDKEGNVIEWEKKGNKRRPKEVWIINLFVVVLDLNLGS